MFDALSAQLGAQLSSITVVSFAIALVGGVLAGFGPCVLPMVTAIFGVTGSLPGEVAASGSVNRATWRSLGLVAIFVGSWANYLVAAICVVLGLRMLEVLHFNIPRMDAESRAG
ncbi:MAG: hypothetical protein RQ731_04150 [Anaerosomatales bacterium]|nr:hypothetical protein [Anaerosomatales bacterium]MDT8433934.1 hypothetical protein [Anaerosomatales bacterium]